MSYLDIDTVRIHIIIDLYTKFTVSAGFIGDDGGDDEEWKGARLRGDMAGALLNQIARSSGSYRHAFQYAPSPSQWAAKVSDMQFSPASDESSQCVPCVRWPLTRSDIRPLV